MNRLLPILNVVALIATIAINYLSNTGMLTGNTMETISDRYENYFTPAGYAFSIWGLIYLGLLAFVIYTGFGEERRKQLAVRVGGWFALSCVANSLWVVAWLSDNIGLSVFIMLVLLGSLLKIVLNLQAESTARSLADKLFVYWPFSVYLGWVTVATIANLAAFLIKIDWNGWGIGHLQWCVIMIVVAGLVNLFMIWNKKQHPFALVGIWALLAIAVANQDKPGGIYNSYTSIIVALIILLCVVISVLTERKKRSRTKLQ